MPPNSRVTGAFRAMKSLGIAEEKVKPVLKSLLKLYDKNWDVIEEENYRVLVDAIFENEESQEVNKKNTTSNEREQEHEEDQEPEEMEQPLKRSRLRHQQEPMQSNNGSSSRLAETSPMQTEDNYVNSQTLDQSKRMQPDLPNSISVGLYPHSRVLTESVPIDVVHTESGYLGCSSKNNSHTGSAKERETESSSQLQIASSSSGEVKLSLSYNLSSLPSGFNVPTIDELLKVVEDKCLRTYKILDPNFSVLKVMEDTCECLLQLKSEKSQTETQVPSNVEPNDNDDDHQNSKSLVCVQHHQTSADVSKGQESVAITLVNEVNNNNESLPSFHYIPENVVFQNAYVNFSLARIEDTKSCSICIGNCLSLTTPCPCAHETGGEFAYTLQGLVKDEFIEECISMNRDPQKRCQYFCKECPLERSKKEDIIKPCKGHLVRKFIKECWWKCDCNKQCGNRVVQRGITRNLQVFMTNGKGWGLRTLEDLPKGTFVCEYVGEILTNAELFDRVYKKSHNGEEYSYPPVLLDADWKSFHGVVKDEEALCLDPTNYGNVARFINHRCVDSTLVEIPVKIETPDHHYYHFAFFTTREVKAMEELTWDYGIDFDDNDRINRVKAFRCQCGSHYCRNMDSTNGNGGKHRAAA